MDWCRVSKSSPRGRTEFRQIWNRGEWGGTPKVSYLFSLPFLFYTIPFLFFIYSCLMECYKRSLLRVEEESKTPCQKDYSRFLLSKTRILSITDWMEELATRGWLSEHGVVTVCLHPALWWSHSPVTQEDKLCVTVCFSAWSLPDQCHIPHADRSALTRKT